MPLSERAQETVSTPERLCASGQPLASPASPARTRRPALGRPPERAWLVSLARVAEHDLVPGRHRGPLAARRLPALARRLLTRGFRLRRRGPLGGRRLRGCLGLLRRPGVLGDRGGLGWPRLPGSRSLARARG